MNYVSTETAKKFHKSDSFVRTLIGPNGCGTTTAMLMDLIMNPPESDYPVLLVASSELVFRDCMLQSLKNVTEDNIEYSYSAHRGVIRNVNGRDISFVNSSYSNFKKEEEEDEYSSMRFSKVLIENAQDCPFAFVQFISGKIRATKRALTLDVSGFDTIDNLKIAPWCDEQKIFIYPSSHIVDIDGNFTVNPIAENTDNLPQDYYNRLLVAGCVESDQLKFSYCKSHKVYEMVNEN